jgi:hypothetical protein
LKWQIFDAKTKPLFLLLPLGLSPSCPEGVYPAFLNNFYDIIRAFPKQIGHDLAISREYFLGMKIA